MKTVTASGKRVAHLRGALHVEVEQQVLALGARALDLRARGAVEVAVDLGPLQQLVLVAQLARRPRGRRSGTRRRRSRRCAAARVVCETEKRRSRRARAARAPARSSCRRPRAPRPRSGRRAGSLNVLHLLAEALDLGLEPDHLADRVAASGPCCRSCSPRASAPAPGSRAACRGAPLPPISSRAGADVAAQPLQLLGSRRGARPRARPPGRAAPPRGPAPRAASRTSLEQRPRALLARRRERASSRAVAASIAASARRERRAQPLALGAAHRRRGARAPARRAPSSRLRHVLAERSRRLDAARARPGSARGRRPTRRPSRPNSFCSSRSVRDQRARPAGARRATRLRPRRGSAA